MKKKTFVLIPLVVLTVIGLVFYLNSAPAIENLKTVDSITIKACEKGTVIEDCYPDPSFVRLKVVSSDDSVVIVNDDKFTITAKAQGTTEIICYDKSIELARIKVIVEP